MRSARSGGFIAVIAVAVLIETSGLHLLLATKHPVIAWTLTLSSMWVLWWLAMDHRALARTTLRVEERGISGAVGRRAVVDVPAAAVASVERPRLMPVSGPPKGYVNITKPASPNVLLVFRAPVTIQVLGMARPVRQLALHLDEPDAFIAAWPCHPVSTT
jgi:hypothetical protein